ncbi:hypothetical protein [Roseivirga pacifica]|uniref:hypothetical protein n=1 Tax=Roseivirga pacifica TaxID=1267423 RepID=UPI00227D5AC3|nr:hypothetical protein [Roseivirga pacifica]
MKLFKRDLELFEFMGDERYRYIIQKEDKFICYHITQNAYEMLESGELDYLVFSELGTWNGGEKYPNWTHHSPTDFKVNDEFEKREKEKEETVIQEIVESLRIIGVPEKEISRILERVS